METIKKINIIDDTGKTVVVSVDLNQEDGAWVLRLTIDGARDPSTRPIPYESRSDAVRDANTYLDNMDFKYNRMS
jgi:hypothetical protein